MPATPVTLYAITCDTCPNALEDDSGGTLFTDLDDAPATARAFGWIVIGDEFLCPTRDDAHQELVDRAMPPEPVFQAPGQLDFDGREQP